MKDIILNRLEDMKTWKLEQWGSRLDIPKRHLKILEEEYGCKTIYDVLVLCAKHTCSMKGFSEKSYAHLEDKIFELLNKSFRCYINEKLELIRQDVSCFRNKYIEILYSVVGRYRGDFKIHITVKSLYPVDDGLSVGFTQDDNYGYKLKENDEKDYCIEGQKGYVWVKVKGVWQEDIVLHFSEGEQILNTNFYEINCDYACDMKSYEEKIALKKEGVEIKPSMLKDEKKDVTISDYKKKKLSIQFLNSIGILSDKETNDILDYLEKSTIYNSDSEEEEEIEVTDF